MVVKDSVFFIVTKSHLVVNLSFFREKRLNIFPKMFIVTDPSWIKTFEIFFRLFFVKSAAVILLFFLNFVNESEVFFLKETFSKYDRLMMAFLKVLVI